MSAITPCLAFYARHATEVNSLVELRNANRLRPSQDLVLFDEVCARASFDASLLVQRLFDLSLAAAGSGPFIGPKSKTSDLDHRMEFWEAFRTLALEGVSTEAFLNVAIWPIAEGLVLVPGTGTRDGNATTAAELRKALARRGMELKPAPGWWKSEGWDHMLPLDAFSITADTQIEDLEAECRKAFEAIGPHLRAIVEFAARGGK